MTNVTTDVASPSTFSPNEQDPQSEKVEKASAIIISALGDIPLCLVMGTEDDPAWMLQLLDARYAYNRTLFRIAGQKHPFPMSYISQNMATYFEHNTSLFSQLERMRKDAVISESHKASMLLASIDWKRSLEKTAAALCTKEDSQLTWDYVAPTFFD